MNAPRVCTSGDRVEFEDAAAGTATSTAERHSGMGRTGTSSPLWPRASPPRRIPPGGDTFLLALLASTSDMERGGRQSERSQDL
jgi:hypothetical protein